jgi:glycosyltransferase involved in cell wall biosynthesis
MDSLIGKDRSLSVLVPVHNEADSVRPFLDELYAKCLSKLTNFEVLMLEDGSSDNTAQVLKECEKAYPNLIAMTEPNKVGYRVTVTKGILQAGKEWILLMDGDGQIEPADIQLAL